MAYRRFNSGREAVVNLCYTTSSRPSDNNFDHHCAIFTIRKPKDRTVLIVCSFLALMCLCGYLPTGNCTEDEKLSQNSVNILVQPKSLEKPLKVLPQPDSTEPSMKPKLNNLKEETLKNENLSDTRLEKSAEPNTTKSQTKDRKPVTKPTSQEHAEVKNSTPSETAKGQNQSQVARIDQEFPVRRQRPLPRDRFEKRELCPAKSQAKYNITFVPLWSSKRFPKMYPTYRPNAQWSKAIGRTHDYSYSMWKLDTFASPAVKSFAEESFAGDFDTESQGETGIYDMFTLPAIYKGVGYSVGRIFVDGMHPLVSLMVKIVPSPDWFVGVSGLNLCSNGKWRRKAVVKLFPVDAGTDKGLTFTSPNWPSYPPDKIYRITSSFPNHGASSFYYPKLKKLSRIGYVIFHKTTEAKTTFKRQKPYKINLAGVSNQSPFGLIHKERVIPNGSHKPTTLVQSDERPGHKKTKKAPVVSKVKPQTKSTLRLSIIDNEPGPPLDCLVSNWGHWSECSKTCGFGRRQRHRFMTQERKNQGLICPKLKEEELCGSMRNCKWSHFQPFRWQSLEVQEPRVAQSKRH